MVGVAPRSPIERFMEKVTVDECGCWLWTGAEKANGYGGFQSGTGICFAHRFAHEFWVGPIPPGYQVDHLCRVRLCVNPDHLEAVTQAENIRRSDSPTAINARKTHCPHGHAYDEANTAYNRLGHRSCRTCARVSAQRGPIYGRSCAECGGPIAPIMRADAMYCSPQCAHRPSQRRYKARKRAERTAAA